MASNPPFLVEDQTDEDFFDKLVNDDDDDVGFNVTTSSTGPGLGASSVYVDGNEADDVKAFADLSISDGVKSGVDGGIISDTGKEGEKVDKGGDSSVKPGLVVEGNGEKSSGSLVSLTSVGSDGLLESSTGNLETEVTDGTTENQPSGSSISGVKEVGWSAFHADPVTNDASGFGSYMDFFNELGDSNGDAAGNVGENMNKGSTVLPAEQVHDTKHVHETAYSENTSSLTQGQDCYAHDATAEQVADGQDVNSSQYWENLYPGWKYDVSTGQWYQVDSDESGANVQGSTDSNLVSDWAVSDGTPEVSYLQKTAQSVSGNAAESGTTESVTNWNQVSQVNGATENVGNWNQAMRASDNRGTVTDWNQVSLAGDAGVVTTDWNQASQLNNGYPSHMVFYPQYPGWYYDTIALEWRSLENYTSSAQSTVQGESQLDQNDLASVQTFSHNSEQRNYGAYGHNDHSRFQEFSSGGGDYNWSGSSEQRNYGAYGHNDNSRSQEFSSSEGDYNWSGSFGNYNQNQHSSNIGKNENVAKSNTVSEYRGNQQLENNYNPDLSASSHVNSQIPNHYDGTVPYNANTIQSQNDKRYFSARGLGQQFSQPTLQHHEQKHGSSDYYGTQITASYSQQAFQSSQQFAHAPTAGKSSAGRPPHALISFGFGGKLIVMKDHSSFGSSSFGSQNPVGGSISVLNLMDVVSERVDSSSLVTGACDYTRALCQQSSLGPLVGGSPSLKELHKWIDERIANSESADMDYRKGEVLRLLLSLLKIACQYYGKFRSPFGTDAVLKESDVPETAIAKLFASVKRNGMQFNQYATVPQCLQPLPSEGQMQATAAEVQSLLVSGRKKEALQRAREGQLWGPALILAAQLGDQFYAETVKQMALRQLVAGSPLRTLCLLIAGQPADVFSLDSRAQSGMPVVNAVQQPAQFGAKMLDDWEENLAVITANRTKDDELVLIHLGDCLWKERSDIIAAHICYLVAEANFEQYSDTARLCLVGADHLKFPRTYASPEAIQRTEIYEYSKVLGNSQFILPSFQPYKLVYAHMLAEVGRISDALKYCQALSKSLKTGRTPETETLRQLVSSLEERIKSHQQGGFSTNLAPAKLVGKLLNLFDSTAHRVVGGLPPPMPTSGSSQGSEHLHQFAAPRVLSSQSTMAMSSLIPSEPTSEWTADSSRMTMHNRSVSEPDIGRTPRQVDSSKDASSSNTGSNASGGLSRFRRFGFGSQLLQKTVGLVLKPRQGRQAKLGDSNKFYYDEKLKRWVEEGAELPAAEPPIAPPPTTAAFQNGATDYNVKSVLKSESSICNNEFPEMKSPTSADNGPAIPPLPPTSNQFSARGRMGVRSRYVDTFNKGGGNPTNLFQSPSVPSIMPAPAGNAKFFVPAAMSPVEETGNSTSNEQETSNNSESDSVAAVNGSIHFPAPTSSAVPKQRFASMDNISNRGIGTSSLSAHSRRTASWSGNFPDAFSPNKSEIKPPGSRLSMPPSSFMPSDANSMHSSTNDGSFSDDLHEVDL